MHQQPTQHVMSGFALAALSQQPGFASAAPQQPPAVLLPAFASARPQLQQQVPHSQQAFQVPAFVSAVPQQQQQPQQPPWALQPQHMGASAAGLPRLQPPPTQHSPQQQQEVSSGFFFSTEPPSTAGAPSPAVYQPSTAGHGPAQGSTGWQGQPQPPHPQHLLQQQPPQVWRPY